MLRNLVVAAAVLLLHAGCGVRTSTIIPEEERPLPALTQTREELLERVNTVHRRIETLGGLSVRYSAVGTGRTTGIQDDFRETQGYLLVSRPDGYIRMQGTFLFGLGRAFDMASDGEVFEVAVPGRERFISGRNDTVTCSDEPILNLRPHHVVEALFVDPSEYIGAEGIVDTLEEVADGIRSYYVLSFIDVAAEPATLLEKIWIDRSDLSVSRKQIFGIDGVLETDVNYAEWEETEAGPFPREITMERPVEEYRLTIHFEEIAVNLEAEPDDFDLPPPPSGTQMIVVDTRPGDCPSGSVP